MFRANLMLSETGFKAQLLRSKIPKGSQFISDFALLGSKSIKAASKNFVEIDTR